MDENKEESKTVRYKLQKQELSSERKEREELNKKRRQSIFKTISLVIVSVIFGFFLAYSFFKNIEIIGILKDTNSVNEKTALLEEYMENIWLYRNDYDDLDTILSDKAYYGMTSFEEDPYTAYMSASELSSFQDGINMNFVGIGVTYSNEGNIFQVKRVLKDSPAEIAGIEAGDILTKVDDIDIKDKTTEEVRTMVTGEEGTLVKITVNREGEEINFLVKRAQVDSTVYGEIIDDVAYIQLFSFGLHTADEMQKYLDSYIDYSKLVIDLRDNSGGYQTAVEDIASFFLKNGDVIMSQTDANGQSVNYKASGKKNYNNFKKIVLLVNENTASASEVLTAALSEHLDYVTIVGTTTYGKGVVQTTYPLKDGSAIKITAYKWLTPKGNWINGEGIKPDVEVKLHDIFYKVALEMDQETKLSYDSVSPYNIIASLALDYLDYDVERYDGYFDKSLEESLTKYQMEHDLKANGVLDTDTYQALISSVKRAYNSDREKDSQLQAALDILR